jgi:tetratricopeptide (TPR) repeat protein
MNAFKLTRKRWFLTGLIAGLFLLSYGLGLAMWQSPQVYYYDLGLKQYSDGDLQKSVQSFDRSLTAYKATTSNRTWLERFVYPRPDRELAALADFQKGKILIRAQQAQPAVDALEDSLMYNPGNGYGADVSLADAHRMHEEAMAVKYDLELLFKNNSSLAQQQGKGKGKDGKDKGGKQVPGTEPGKQPGKGDRDAI